MAEDPEKLLSQALRAHAASTGAGRPFPEPVRDWMPPHQVRPQRPVAASPTAAWLLLGAVLLGLLIGVIAGGLSVR
ncbi:hypothetical protein D5S17_17915 [Pseudonocardiaceae bacterium YIM PH 21723]|nr:hypothetical protein D5S17_17915 [Pseudonocardiaceae bacterium YIM PH 21723]